MYKLIYCFYNQNGRSTMGEEFATLKEAKKGAKNIIENDDNIARIIIYKWVKEANAWSNTEIIIR